MLASLALCEAAALGWSYVEDRALYYTRPARPVPPRWRLRREGMGEITDLRLHPYLGYRYVNAEVNNQGFEDAHDYPFVANENQVVVGVFGGSVAWFLTRFEAQHHLMRDILQRVPRFRGKEVKILNFAVGAYKQPQQMLALSYFTMLGQRFDAVIDISGFNGVASANQNRRAGVSLSMPNIKLMMPLADLATRGLSVEQMGRAYSSLSHAQAALTSFERAEKCPSALCNVLLRTYATSSWRRYVDKSTRFDAEAANPEKGLRTSLLHIDALEIPAEDEDRTFRQMASIWAESALVMNDLLARRGVPFFVVLQPNQYHQTRRVFTAEERREAIAKGRYREGVEAGYPLLAERLRELGSRGVSVLDTGRSSTASAPRSAEQADVLAAVAGEDDLVDAREDRALVAAARDAAVVGARVLDVDAVRIDQTAFEARAVAGRARDVVGVGPLLDRGRHRDVLRVDHGPLPVEAPRPHHHLVAGAAAAAVADDQAHREGALLVKDVEERLAAVGAAVVEVPTEAQRVAVGVAAARAEAELGSADDRRRARLPVGDRGRRRAVGRR